MSEASTQAEEDIVRRRTSLRGGGILQVLRDEKSVKRLLGNELATSTEQNGTFPELPHDNLKFKTSLSRWMRLFHCLHAALPEMLAEPASIAQNKRIAPVVVVPRENLDEHTDIPVSLNMSKHKK